MIISIHFKDKEKEHVALTHVTAIRQYPDKDEVGIWDRTQKGLYFKVKEIDIIEVEF